MLALVVAVAIGWRTTEWFALGAESKSFVDGAVATIAASSSPQQLLADATPELRESLAPRELNGVFDAISHLGSFAGYMGSSGRVNLRYMIDVDGSAKAAYVARARYTNGLATFHLGLAQRDGHWMIDRFHVDFLQFPPLGSGLF